MLAKGALVVFASLLSLIDAAPYADFTPATNGLSRRDGPATSVDFSAAGSQWIWTGEEDGPGGTAPISSRAFRKTITSPSGKCAVCATILITADNDYTVYVNGQQQGSGSNWEVAQAYTVALQSESNVFAVNATNVGGPAGLIATIIVNYNDGTSDTFITDSSWKTFIGNPPIGFQNPGTIDLLWPNAIAQGPVTASPWGGATVSIPPALDISQSHWIWTSEATSPGGAVSPGTRAFRKTIVSPPGKCAVCAKAVIAVDNEYTLYLNGDVVGSGTDWTQAQYFSMISDLNTDSNLFAVEATNILTVPNPAGVIATILIAYNDGTTETYVTDTTWKTLPGTLPSGFQLPSTDDSTWNAATDEGVYGVGPWKQINVPAA